MKREQIIEIAKTELVNTIGRYNLNANNISKFLFNEKETKLFAEMMADFALSLHQKEHEPTEPTMSQPMEQEGMSAEELIAKYEKARQSQMELKKETPLNCSAQHQLLDQNIHLFDGILSDLKSLEQYAASRIAEGKKQFMSAKNPQQESIGFIEASGYLSDPDETRKTIYAILYDEEIDSVTQLETIKNIFNHPNRGTK